MSNGDGREVLIFIAIIASAIILAFALMNSGLELITVLPILVLGILIITFFPRYNEFKEYERGVVFRLGKFSRVVGPGFVFLIPYIEKINTVDLRTQILDIKPQEVITQDDLHLEIDAVVYYRISDPRKVIIEIKDHKQAITNLLLSQIRNVVGKMLLEEVLEKTESINLDLYSTIKEVENDWGITTLRVEVQSIEMPKSLVESFKKKREAKEYKEQVETEAQAKQISIELLDRIAKNIDNKTLAILYVDALKQIASGKSNKIIFPLELSSMAASISKAMKGEKTDNAEIINNLLTSYQEARAKNFDEGVEKPKKLVKKKK
ncbi:MAG: SPFH domain-containing protein [Candidatus Micrarchaeota archaeon]